MSPLALALVKLAIAAAPLAAMAKLARIYPGRRMVLLALAPALSTLALVATPAAMWLVVILDVVFAAAVVVDVWSLPARRDFSVHRHTQRIASLQKRHAVTLTVSNHAGRAHRLEVRDGVPHVLQPTPSDFAETLAAGSRLVCEYHLRPSRRGAFDLDAVHLRAISRRRLWSRLLDYPCPSTIHVYPDMKQLGEYALLARTNRLSLMGVRRTRRMAGGLSEYVINNARPLLADREVIARLQESGELRHQGTLAHCWLGVPLMRDGVAVGVIAVQSYSPDIAFTVQDQKLLTFVAHHIGGSLARKRSQDHLRAAHAELESRVNARTRELEEANDAYAQVSGTTEDRATSADAEEAIEAIAELFASCFQEEMAQRRPVARDGVREQCLDGESSPE